MTPPKPEVVKADSQSIVPAYHPFFDLGRVEQEVSHHEQHALVAPLALLGFAFVRKRLSRVA